MKRRLACLPLLLVLVSAPALRTAARAQDDGSGQKDGGDDKPEAKPADDAEAPKSDEDKSAGVGNASEESKPSDEGSRIEKPMISIQVMSSDGGGPVKADASIAVEPQPKTHKKTTTAKRAKAVKRELKNAPVKTPNAVKTVVVPPSEPPPPPPPPAVPSTPVEPWNP